MLRILGGIWRFNGFLRLFVNPQILCRQEREEHIPSHFITPLSLSEFEKVVEMK